MNILCIIPPHIPSYFNAGHHLPLYYVAAYLRKNISDVNVKCIDAGALNYTWKEICDALVKPIDLIVLMNEFDGVDTFPRFMNYKKIFCPTAKVITFGRLSKQIPRFFLQFDIDAIHHQGDYETGVASYVNHLKNPENRPTGVVLQNGEPANPGVFLESDNWVLPDVNEIPYHDYNFMYRNDLNKFCGIPERQELVVPLGRGCPFMCDFCDVWVMQGKVERRLSVTRTVNYIVESFEKQPFEYVSFYCPTFTLHHKWVMDFCNQMMEKKERYPWKCITVLKCLNRDLVRAMAASGCVRISLGIESFTRSAAMGLPKCKQDILGPFEEIVKICNQFNVELNCFIMLGMPGDTPDDVEFTLRTCLRYGARIRPTIYTPFQKLRDNMTLEQVAEFNRQYFPKDHLPPDVAQKYYKLFYDFQGDHPTTVTRNIASKRLVAS